jgi:hypothetical protein
MTSRYHAKVLKAHGRWFCQVFQGWGTRRPVAFIQRDYPDWETATREGVRIVSLFRRSYESPRVCGWGRATSWPWSAANQ